MLKFKDETNRELKYFSLFQMDYKTMSSTLNHSMHGITFILMTNIKRIVEIKLKHLEKVIQNFNIHFLNIEISEYIINYTNIFYF